MRASTVLQRQTLQEKFSSPSKRCWSIFSDWRRVTPSKFCYGEWVAMGSSLRTGGSEPTYHEPAPIETSSLVALTEGSIIEQVEKARAKIESGDYSGAIASSYTLLEGFLKEVLRRTPTTSFNENEGDIRELYKIAMDALNWNPKGENLESYLKTILFGLKSQVSGLYNLANKASDRHARRYDPARHHAKLAVNATFTLCEFLLDSFEYRQKNGRLQPETP